MAYEAAHGHFSYDQKNKHQQDTRKMTAMKHFPKNQSQEHFVSEHSCCTQKNQAMYCVVELITVMHSSSGSMIRPQQR
jgi:hypothetical protein